MKSKHLSAILLLSALVSPTAHAVEGALGRPVSGAEINPFAGVIPPAPGLIVGVSELYYKADIGASRTVPIGVNLALDIESEVSFTDVSFTYIWDTHAGPWNFASALSLPITWLEVEADVAVGPETGVRKEDATGLFDLAFVPLFASYHINQTQHLGLSMTVWAPTGKYDSHDLANLSLNNWTFIPTVSYTHLWPEHGLEFSAAWGMQFYTENEDTDYQNGIVSDLEATLIKRLPEGLGIGIIGSWIEQVTDDDGDTADALNGFSGHAFGIGPILTYSKKFGESQLDLNARWVHEFEVEKRVEGDLLALSASWKL
ncbi:transporter [Luteolibacter yonseiensis]|uniref:Transporter n=1 Tax=Luteolibacter yonseiensis TaxID=1144680 RepID=A0A934R2F7_9BACT|nr:transporter [Luteolibacter yonseiensis]MBK1814090.1 transporter [Luteolibacter yonseiensis]